MRRRQLLKMSAAAVTTGVGPSVAGADGTADPRPEMIEGTRPNNNVKVTETGALPPEPSEIPAGDWISHGNGWSFEDTDCENNARFLANNTIQRYTIAGEEFVLDSFDDWNFVSDPCEIRFEYVTPPNPVGKTYEVSWTFEAQAESLERFEDPFPFSNQIRIVPPNEA